MAKGFDLSNYEKLASDDGVWMQLHDPVTDEPVVNDDNEPVRIQVIGVDNPKYRQKQHEFMNRRLKRNKITLGTAEQLSAEKVETLMVCVVNWEGFIKDGAPWPYNKENARTLLTHDSWKWIREQVDEFINERQNFLQE